MVVPKKAKEWIEAILFVLLVSAMVAAISLLSEPANADVLVDNWDRIN